jgi:hypothetical protein
MSTERILQQIERLSYLVGQHAGLLTHLETTLPHHEDTIIALRQQFEAHIGFLLVNVESYTTLQQSITNTIEQLIATAYLVPPPTAIPVEATPTPRRHPRTGHYPYYAVRVGRMNDRHLHQLGRLFSSDERHHQRFSRLRIFGRRATLP